MTEDQNYSQYLTPSKEEQIILILAGKCPHNEGWAYEGHSHNESLYKCALCGVTMWY
jgi:hypothetical protein